MKVFLEKISYYVCIFVVYVHVHVNYKIENIVLS